MAVHLAETDEIIRVLLVDDHPVMRVGVRAVLEGVPDIEVVGEAGCGAEMRELAAALRPHVLLLDPWTSGQRLPETIEWLQTHCQETAVLVWAVRDEDALLAAAVEAGAAGFVTKEEYPDAVVEAIRRAARGEVLFDEEQVARACRWCADVRKRWEDMTTRERQVLRLLAEARHNAAIAKELGIARKTVEHHVTRVLKHLGVASRSEAAVWAHRHLADVMCDDP